MSFENVYFFIYNASFWHGHPTNTRYLNGMTTFYDDKIIFEWVKTAKNV